MARSTTSQLIIELLDRVTGPARKAAGSLRGLNRTVKDSSGINVSMADRIAASQARTNAAIDRARLGVLESVGTYYLLRDAVAAPIRAAAGFETALEDIGQKADIPVERLGALGEQIKQVARDTNQATSDIASAVDALVGRGASTDVAVTAAAPIGKAATAYRAATDDLASAAWAAVDNLKVPADQIGLALDMMAKSGKEGAFELRDMAQYFPALGAAYQGLGQEGVSSVADLSAALQVVRKGTGDSASAATNLSNVLQKMRSPATIRAFKKMGVSLEKELKKAAENGLTPIEAIADITEKTLKGDLSKLGYLFEDAQVQAGVRALIQGRDEYQRIRDEALKASGTVDKDYERRVKTAAGAMERWKASVENLQIALGTALLPALNDILDAIIPIINKIGEWTQAHPDLTSNIAGTVLGLLALRGALSVLTFAGLLGKSGALALAAAGFKILGAEATAGATAVEVAGARINRATLLGGLGRLAAKAAPWVALASLSGDTPNTKTTEQRKAETDDLRGRAEKDLAAIAAIGSLEAAKQLIELRAKQEELLAKVEAQGADLTDSFDSASIDLSKELLEVEGAIDDAESRVGDLDAALKLVGMESVSPNIDTASLDRAIEKATLLRQTLRSTQSGGKASAGDPIHGARAKGGPISAGKTYLVGENGPERITPSRSGYVNASGSGAGLSIGSITITPQISVPGATAADAHAIAKIVMARIKGEIGMAMRGAMADLGVGA